MDDRPLAELRARCWIDRDGYCKTPALVDEAVHLLGGDLNKLKTGPVMAYQFRLCCSGSRTTPDSKYVAWLLSDATIHPDHHAEYGGALPSTEFCRNHVRVIVAQQIAALEQEDQEWRADENAEGIALLPALAQKSPPTAPRPGCRCVTKRSLALGPAQAR